MRTLGSRIEPPITFQPSADALLRGARFNDDIHRLPTGRSTCIPKGLYRFKSFAESNRFDLDAVASAVAQAARERA